MKRREANVRGRSLMMSGRTTHGSTTWRSSWRSLGRRPTWTASVGSVQRSLAHGWRRGHRRVWSRVCGRVLALDAGASRNGRVGVVVVDEITDGHKSV